MSRRTPRKLRRSPLAVAIGTLLAAGTVQAAVITVDTAADGPVGSMPGCSLRSAVASANEGTSHDGCASGSTGADEIIFDSSLAHSTITLSEGEIEITDALTVTGPSPADPAGIVINGDNASRIFNITGDTPSDFEVNLNSFTLTGGYTAADIEPGGAVRSIHADLKLDHVLVTGNSTTGNYSYGGALWVGASNATLVNTTVSGNSTAGGNARGGGLNVVNGNAALNGSTVSGNSTGGDYAHGGGLFVSSGDATLSNSTVSGNYTQGEFAHGGGLFASSDYAALDNSTIADNFTAGDYARGGGLAFNSGDIRLNHSTVSGNSTAGDYARGGGLFFNSGDVTLSNTTVSGNATAGTGADGGGLRFFDGGATLIHSTVAYNTASNGADGVHRGSAGELTLNNSLVVQGGAGETACNAEADTHVNSLATDSSCIGTATDPADISITPLADNGGPTLTHALAFPSAAISGAGDCEAEFGIDRDQRGQPRPGAGAAAPDCDIGAFEVQFSTEPSVITVTISDDAAPGALKEECSLRSAVLSANHATAVDACELGSPYANRIVFGPGLAGSSVTLNQGQMEITKALTITGPDSGNPNGIVINGGNASRIFNIEGSAPGDFEVNLEGLTLTGGNTALPLESGGAVYASYADLNLDRALVTGNSTQGDGAFGGGVFVRFGDITLSNSTVSDNATAGSLSGGGGLAATGGDTTLVGSTVSGNSTAGNNAFGGGVSVHLGDIALTNSTVSGNMTAGESAAGGGLFIRYGDVTLTHATVAYNTAYDGTDGVHRIGKEGELILTNSLVVQGVGETACNAQAATHVNSLATDSSCTGMATGLAGISLGPLADNGGPTQAHALIGPSVAVDAAGDCTADFGIDQDQRGQPRPGILSTACDVGAFELQGEPELTLSTQSLDFGDVRVGSTTVPLSVTAENTGAAGLAITAVGPISGADAAAFGISGNDCAGVTLAPAQTCTVELTFSPDGQGAFAASFDFASNAPSSPDAVSLAGIGVAPEDDVFEDRFEVE